MAKSEKSKTAASQSTNPRPSNGDTVRVWNIGGSPVRGLGSFHKTLPHDEYGEVDPTKFDILVAAATTANGSGFENVDVGDERHPGDGTFKLTNPRGGLASDRLTHHPENYVMPPAPAVDSDTTAAEMTELYWMAMLRDVPFNEFETKAGAASSDINEAFGKAFKDADDPAFLRFGSDVPGSAVAFKPFTPQTLFRLGLPGDDIGPMLSQFFVRPVAFGTQTIDTRQRPYRHDRDYLIEFDDWLKAQNSGKDVNGQGYSDANEDHADFFESDLRYISTMRDLARFVNKDALHQAYFNATLIMLSGGAKWTVGNPYGDGGTLAKREAGFGVLGGPHILALVSEVATRALKVVWNQKWQVHLRLRPEAYGGIVHVQEHGISVNGMNKKRAYGLPDWLTKTEAAKAIVKKHNGYLLPMAFTPGSPAHPAYGAGHATVAGACVTVLKAYFMTIDGTGKPIPLRTLVERDVPYGAGTGMKSYLTGRTGEVWERLVLSRYVSDRLTIEGELNKLAQNVAMGRSMGGVHWRTDNTRSLLLGEALAAEILHGIACDVVENPVFTFRTFSRKADGQPKMVIINKDAITVDGKKVTSPISAL